MAVLIFLCESSALLSCSHADNAYCCDPRVKRFKESEKAEKEARKRAKAEAARKEASQRKEEERRRQEEERLRREKEEEQTKAAVSPHPQFKSGLPTSKKFHQALITPIHI